jgi:hypothetical protein
LNILGLLNCFHYLECLSYHFRTDSLFESSYDLVDVVSVFVIGDCFYMGLLVVLGVWASSSAWYEYYIGIVGVGGSNPPLSTIF